MPPLRPLDDHANDVFVAFVDAVEHDRFVSRALLQELLLEILDTRSRKAESPNRKENLPHRIRELIEKNVGAHHQVRIRDLLEKELGYSYEHLCRMFKDKYGVPPLKYLNALCISRAKLLLRDTDLQVAVIARRLGFHDPMYFSQLFRKYTRQTPSRYRSRTRTKDEDDYDNTLYGHGGHRERKRAQREIHAAAVGSPAAVRHFSPR